MENKFTIVSIDDWEGLYYKGYLIEEDHEIHRGTLIRLMKQHKVWDVDFVYLNEQGESLVKDSAGMFNTYEEAKQYLEE